MTMYTEEFEDSEAEDSQASFHVAFTRSKSAESGSIKQRSNHDGSSTSTHSQGSSASSTRPVKSSRSPEKAKSRRMKAKTEVDVNGERKITVSQEDYEVSANEAPSIKRSSSEASSKHAEESEGSYSDDFHSAGSELENVSSNAASVDSTDADQHKMLDLPPAANNLGYTY